jgi:broad specificity phosphatase PhoE
MPSLKVTLVRHGETEANVGGILQGQLDVPISENGKNQARLLGVGLKREYFTRVYTSDLSRAVGTLFEMSKELNIYRPIVLSIDRRLRERYYGPAQGKPVSELKRAAADTGLEDNIHLYTPEGGESYESFVERIDEFLGDLFHLCDHGKHVIRENIIIVTHGALMTAVMRYFHDNKDKFECVNFAAGQALVTPANTGITRMVIGSLEPGSKGKRNITFDGFSDIRHLQLASEPAALN